MEGKNELAKQQNSIAISRLDDIPQLTGHENYHSWALAMTNIWRDMKMYQVVVKGERPNRETSKKDIKLYKSLCRDAIHILYNDRRIVQDEIVRKLSKDLDLNDPHIIWRFLEAKYEMGSRRSNPFNALIFQVSTVMKGLSDFYDSLSSQSLSTLIEKFEIEWLLLQKLTEDYTTNSPNRKNLFHILQDDVAKCQALLGFLGDRFKEVCNDIINKGNFSFAQVKQRLLTIESEVTQNQKVSHTLAHDYTSAPNSIEPGFKSTNHQEPLRTLQNQQQNSMNSNVESKDLEINLKIGSPLEISNHSVEVNSCPHKSKQPISIIKEITTEQIPIGESTGDEERFDYSKAPSMLRGMKREGIWEQSGKKKPFDPYLKDMDVKNGARRPPIARAGKSYTFRQ